MIRTKIVLPVLALIALMQAARAEPPPGPAMESAPVLSAPQRDFMKWRFGMFVHFNLATFAGTDWAGGYEDPGLFNPTKLDCGQWADSAKEAGMTYLVLTVKHTEGIALYPSTVTTRDTRMFRKFRKGKGDIVREFVDACRLRGLKVGLYYCFPGDYSDVAHRNAPPAGMPDLHGLPPEAAGDYVGFMKRQLAEILTTYGPIDLLWIDQYDNKYTGSRWPEILAFLKALQPGCLVLANNARSLEESDILSYEHPWKGDMPDPGNPLPAEVCDTIQTDARWFWRLATKPSDLRTGAVIVDMLRRCNSRNANYLLDVPPDPDGLISGPQLERLREASALLRRGDPDKILTLK
jgi:alpha-L-fucosidase